MSFNLVINFAGDPFQVAMLRKNIKNANKDNQFKVLDLSSGDLNKPVSEEEKELFAKINSLSKIYIIDHGMPNSPSIVSGHYSEISNYLARRINPEKIKEGKERLNIDLISCSTAVGEHKSFAGLFHRYLGQVHGIDADVVARTGVSMLNRFSGEKGVLTDSLANYAFRVICDDLGIADLFLKMNPDAHTQQAGSTVTFRWTKEGKEIVLDTQVDAFAKMALEFKNDLFKAIATQKNQAALMSLFERDISQVMELCSFPEKLTLAEINLVCKILNFIKSDLEKSNVSGAQKIVIASKIDEIIKFRKKAIDPHTIKTVFIESDIHKVDPEIEDPVRVIKRDLFNTAILELNRVSNREDKSELANATKALLVFTCEYCAYRMKNDLPFNREADVCHFVKNALVVINTPGIGKNEKIKQLHLLEQNLEGEINNSVLSSISGGFDGMKISAGYGGLTTLKSMFPLANQWSKDEKKAVETYYNLIGNFTDQAVDFIENTNYQGFVPGTLKEKIEEEGAQYTNKRLEELNDAIAKVYKLIGELSGNLSLTPEMKVHAKDTIRMADAKVGSAQKEFEKLKFAIENSPEKNVKEVYETQVIPCIRERINVLALLSAQLREYLNSLS